MGFDLTNERIQDTYQQIVQVSGSTLVNGTGSAIPFTVPTASFAITASFALNAGDIDTGSLVTTSSFNAYTSSNDAALDDKLDTSVFNTYTSSNDSALADKLDTTTFTSYSSSVSTRLTTDESDISTNASNISANGTRIGSLEAATSSYAVKSSNNTFTGTQTFDNISVNGTASIGFLQSVTGSAKIIGDAYIVLNNDTPSERYAGVKVYDSGSTNNSASFEFDGQTNDWFYEYTDDGGATEEFGVAMFGPGYNTRGSHVYPSNNTILKGTGDHHIEDSSITDDGTEVTIGASRLRFTEGEVVIGRNAVASGSVFDGVAIGDDAYANSNSVSIGSSAHATGSSHIVMGKFAKARSGFGATILGAYSSGVTKSTVIGSYNAPDGEQVIQIGYNVADVDINNGINIGDKFLYDGSSTLTLAADTTLSASGNFKLEGSFTGGGPSSVTGNRRFNFGAASNTLSTDDAVILGGESNNLSAAYNVMVGTSGTTISSGDLSGVFGGYQHTISGGSRNITIGGESVTNNKDYAIVLGRKSFTTPATHTTYTANLDVSGSIQISGSVHSRVQSPSVASNTASIDLSTSNFQQLNLTSATLIANPTNAKQGSTYTYYIESGSLATFGTDYKFAGGTTPTLSNGVDIVTFVSFESGSSVFLYGTGLADFS